MEDTLIDERKLRMFYVIDDCNREATAIDARLSYPARAFVEMWNNLKEEVGATKYIRCDNFPEFIYKTFMNWCKRTLLKSNIPNHENRCRTDI